MTPPETVGTERERRIAEIEAYFASVSLHPVGRYVSWLIKQIHEARVNALNEAAAIVDQARDDEETDLRCVRDRIRMAASAPTVTTGEE